MKVLGAAFSPMVLVCFVLLSDAAIAAGNPKIEAICQLVKSDVYNGMISAGLAGEVAASGAYQDCIAFHERCLAFEKDVFDSCADYGEVEQMRLVPEWRRALSAINSPGIADNNHKGVLACNKMLWMRDAQTSTCQVAIDICKGQSKTLDYGHFAKTLHCESFPISRNFSAQVPFDSGQFICSAGESEKGRIDEKKTAEQHQCAAISRTRGTASTEELVREMQSESDSAKLSAHEDKESQSSGGYDPVEELRKLDNE